MTTEKNQENGKTTLVIAGRLDTLNAEKLLQEINTMEEPLPKQLTVDCSKLEYISSSGLRAFITLLKKSQKAGGVVELTGISESVKEVFDITGFSSLFGIK